MNDSKIKLFIIGVILVSLGGFYQYILFLDAKKEGMHKQEYTKVAKDMRREMESYILQKQKATTAIALGLSTNKELIRLIKQGHIPKNYFKPLIKKLRADTEYKNIWIDVINRHKRIIHRSWSHRWGDRVLAIRKDVDRVFKTAKVVCDVNVDRYSFAIRSLVPIKEKHRVIGVIELISHFNSLEQLFHKKESQLIVLLDKSYKKHLKYPYTKHFIKGYYVANFQVKKELEEFLQKHTIQELLKHPYILTKKHLIVPYVIESFENKPMGYAFIFKDLESLSYEKVDFLIFKWMAFGGFVMLLLVLLFDVYLFRRMKKQKLYYQNIINSSTNVVIVCDKNSKVVEANKIFFEFIQEYKTLEEFNKSVECVCDFFVEEEGYLGKRVEDLTWLEYLLKYPRENHKVKIRYKEKTFYFVISASLVSQDPLRYAIVFTDITNEETYKLDLENISVIDPLTNIGNRRYFNRRLEDEMSLSVRYKIPLSLIMFDIDFFKKINDNHGHDVGDEVLIEYSRLIKENLRENDVFCRVGGEEFMIILPYVTKDEAYQVAEKLRILVQDHKKVLPITMSFGVSEYIQGELAKSFLKRVDEAVYESKENGRNSVSVK